MTPLWDMLLGTALLTGLRILHIDIYYIRILYVYAQLAVLACLGLLYQRISRDGDEQKSVKVEVTSLTGGPVEEKEMTRKDYDMSVLLMVALGFGVRVAVTAVTVGIQVYVPYPFIIRRVPILLMASEPFTFYREAYYLLALYILNKDLSKEDKLKPTEFVILAKILVILAEIPVPVDSPVAKSEAMKELPAEQERQVKKNDDDVGEPTPAIEDSATTTGSQPLSRAEGREKTCVESADVNEEQ